eukprot:c8766_g1_i1.p1 GENE.c8766_g1_i1~~c8766_g1_i1.p1  ORF type:complete len:649 (-),score=105.92 c8766_g1_i1:181-2127(-)
MLGVLLVAILTFSSCMGDSSLQDIDICSEHIEDIVRHNAKLIENSRAWQEYYANRIKSTSSTFSEFASIVAMVPPNMQADLLRGVSENRDPRSICPSNFSDPTSSMWSQDQAMATYETWLFGNSDKRTSDAFRGMNIGVVGSGIAGVTAARFISEQGGKVTVFEANELAGGRTKTYWRNDESKWIEEGGMRLKEDNEKILVSLAGNLNLSLVQFSNPSASGYIFINGNLTEQDKITDQLFLGTGLNVRKRCRRNYAQIVGDVLKPFMCTIDRYPELKFDVFALLGDTTEFEILRNSGLSAEELRYVSVAGNTAGYMRRISGSDWFADSKHFAIDPNGKLECSHKADVSAPPNSPSDATDAPFMTIKGGLQSVTLRQCYESAKKGASFKFGQRVVSIKTLDSSVVVCSEPSAPGRINLPKTCESFDGVIVTVAAPVIPAISFSPPLPQRKLHAYQTTEYDEATKVALVFSDAPWNTTRFPWGTIVSTDLSSRQLYFLNDSVVLSYTWGVDAERMAAKTLVQSVDTMVRDLGLITGISERSLLTKLSTYIRKSWKHDPLFGGAFALYFAGNFLDSHCGLIGDDYVSGSGPYGLESRVRFTGEHKDPLGHAWVETSLISVAQELTILRDVLLKTKPSSFNTIDSSPQHSEL